MEIICKVKGDFAYKLNRLTPGITFLKEDNEPFWGEKFLLIL
jgi:hypothetical protein